MDSMDAPLIEQALNYHGQQLQILWKAKRSEDELANIIRREPGFEIYEQREKTLSVEDNKKRLKLQEFIVKKADILYNKSNLENSAVPIYKQDDYEEAYGTMPGLDSFVKLDKSQLVRNFLESLESGDVIYAQVLGKSTIGLLLKVLCSCSDCPRIVSEHNVKALILNSSTVPAVEKKGVTRDYTVNDLVCVCVNEVNIEAERVIASMTAIPREGLVPHPPLGLIQPNDLPEAYRRVVANKEDSFESILKNSLGFGNPNNIKYLSDLLSLGQDNHSNMIGLRQKFPPNEYGVKLREAQATKWSLHSVTEGIDHFKAGRHSEAFKCLNKALLIDPLNDEGLVARGCLFVTTGSLNKAVDDFEMAMKLNQGNISARKYLAETLVALGRNYKDEGQFDEAEKAFKRCLIVKPQHDAAKKEIEFLKMGLIDKGEKNPLKIIDIEEQSDSSSVAEDKKKFPRKSRTRKKRKYSSSSSSTSESSESESSTTSSSSESRSSSESPLRKKSNKNNSLSPLSKRMALYNLLPEVNRDLLDSRYEINDYESEVRKFLDKSKDDSDYEEKVKIFLKTAAMWKIEREKEKNDENKKKKRKKKRRKRKINEERKKLKKKENRKKYKSRRKRIDSAKRSPLTDLQSNSKLTNSSDDQITDIVERESDRFKPKIFAKNGLISFDAFRATRQRNQNNKDRHEFSNDNELHSMSSPLKKKSEYAHEKSSEFQDNYKSLMSPQKKASYNYSSKSYESTSLAKTSRTNDETSPEHKRLPKKYQINKKLPSRDSSEDSSLERFRNRLRSNSKCSSSSRLRSPARSRSRSFSGQSRNSSNFGKKYKRSFSRSYSRSPSKYQSRSRSRSRSDERKYRYQPTRGSYVRGGRYNPRFQGHNNYRGGHLNHRGPNLNHGDPNFNNGGPNFNGGGPNFNNGGPNFNNGGPNLNYGGPNFNNGNRFHNNPNNRFINNRRGFQHRYNNANPNFRGRGMPNRGGRFFHNNRGGFGFMDNRKGFRGRPPFPHDRNFYPQEGCPYPPDTFSPSQERPPYSQGRRSFSPENRFHSPERDTFSQELDAYSREKRSQQLRSYSKETDSPENRSSSSERIPHSHKNRLPSQERHSNLKKSSNDKKHSPDTMRKVQESKTKVNRTFDNEEVLNSRSSEKSKKIASNKKQR